jgi:hypothetical protein
MLGLAFRSWRLAFRAAGAMPDSFVSSGVAACLLLAAQAKLAGLLRTDLAAAGHISPTLLVLCGGVLVLACNVARQVFVAPLAWAVHRWVLLQQSWNELALPVKPGQRRLGRWMAALAAATSFTGMAVAAVGTLGWAMPPLVTAVLLIAVSIAGVRCCLAGPAIALDVPAPLRASWQATRGHYWFTAGSFALTILPLSAVSTVGILAWHQHASLLGLGLFGACYVILPAVISAWQAGLYALLRGEAAVPAAQPIPASEPSLLLTVWQGWRLAARGARETKLLLPSAIALMALGRYLVLEYIDRQHLELGRSGTLLEDFGWSGLAWFGFIHLQAALLSAYAGAAVVCAVLRRIFLTEATSLAGLWPTRRLLAITGFFLLLIAVPYLRDAAIFVRDLLMLTIGPVSTALTELLFAPLLIAAGIGVLRLSLLAVPIAVGHRFAAAESFSISRGHVWLIAATYCLAMSPVLVGVGVLFGAPSIGDLARKAVVLPACAILAALLGSGITAALYQILFPGMPEEERPSRNALRRREPALDVTHLAEQPHPR